MRAAFLLLCALTSIACSSTSEVGVAGAGKVDAAAVGRTESALRQYLREGYGRPGGEASWYAHLRAVRVSGTTVVATTDFPGGSEGKRLALPICSAISGFVYATENRHHGVSAVRGARAGRRVPGQPSEPRRALRVTRPCRPLPTRGHWRHGTRHHRQGT